MLDRPIGDVIKLVDASGVDEEVIIQLVENMRDAFQVWVRHCIEYGCFTWSGEIYYAVSKIKEQNLLQPKTTSLRKVTFQRTIYCNCMMVLAIIYSE